MLWLVTQREKSLNFDPIYKTIFSFYHWSIRIFTLTPSRPSKAGVRNQCKHTVCCCISCTTWVGIIWAMNGLGNACWLLGRSKRGKSGSWGHPAVCDRLIQHTMLEFQKLSYTAACPFADMHSSAQVKFIRKSKPARRERVGCKNGNDD